MDDASLVDRAIEATRPDAVYHLAGASHVGESWRASADGRAAGALFPRRGVTTRLCPSATRSDARPETLPLRLHSRSTGGGLPDEAPFFVISMGAYAPSPFVTPDVLSIDTAGRTMTPCSFEPS